MTDDLVDDLAYVKALAEEGRDTPLVSGLIYVIWGLVIGGTTLLVYGQEIGITALGFADGPWPWAFAMALGWALSMYFGRRTNTKPGASTLGNRTAASVWMSVGIFTTSFWLTLMFVHDNFTSFGIPPFFLFSLMFPLAFGLLASRFSQPPPLRVSVGCDGLPGPLGFSRWRHSP